MLALFPLLIACHDGAESSGPKDSGSVDSDSPTIDTDTGNPVDSDTGSEDSDTGEIDTGEDSDSDTQIDTWVDVPCTNTFDTARTFAAPRECDRSSPWIDVAAGGQITCGVRSDGCAECWGYWVEREHYEPPGEAFTAVALPSFTVDQDYARVCGLTSKGDAVCWGGNHWEPSYDGSPIGPYVTLATNAYGTAYALEADGSLVSWGYDHDECFVGPYAAVTTNGVQYAVIDAEGRLRLYVSWENDVYPAGVWTSFSMGFSLACGIRADLDGAISCIDTYYGEEVEGMPPEQASTGFLDVCVAADDEACALDASGIPVCWNTASYYDDLLSPPPGPFIKITCGSGHACGLTAEGAIECWGDDIGGETTPPS